MLIKATRTGNRVFGAKAAPVSHTVTVEGVKLRVTEADTWSSDEHSGEYIRCTFLEAITPVDPWPNLKTRKMEAE